jgi:hypothetical protein
MTAVLGRGDIIARRLAHPTQLNNTGSPQQKERCAYSGPIPEDFPTAHALSDVQVTREERFMTCYGRLHQGPLMADQAVARPKNFKMMLAVGLVQQS